ncbi:MAG: TonB-dependent receptor domain-containing protein [Candidatus Neomarinimicrobiota bacterium]
MIKFVIAVIFSVTSFANAQSSTISGVVADSINGNFLIGANVIIDGTSLGMATDNEGSYSISNISPGTYTIKVSYIGYETSEKELTISDQIETKVDFNLKYTTVEGKAVVVTAQARGQMDAINKQLKAKSIKNIVSSDRIQELPESNAAEAVARIPGVSIRRDGGEGNKVIIRGLSPKYNKITVNGTNLASTDPNNRSTDISMISQYMLEGIEVTKAGTPDQDGDVLGGTINFILKKAKPGFHGNIITQGIYNGLEKEAGDYKYVGSVGNRFFNDKLGLLAQIDLENRTRSSHDLGARYNNAPANLDSVNALSFSNMVLTDINRNNDRTNSLFVLDYQIPRGNISYSGLNSKIKKNQTNYSDVFALVVEDRLYNTGEGINDINVISETWKYEQKLLNNLSVDAFTSFSMSKNDSLSYLFRFNEPDPYTESVLRKSIDNINNSAANNIGQAYFLNGTKRINNTTEKESSFGANIEYDFNLLNKISGKIKAGFKSRKKSRLHDQNQANLLWHNDIGYWRELKDSTINHFGWLEGDIQGSYNERYARYPLFYDDDYDLSGFLDGAYELGPAADLNKLKQIYQFATENPAFYNNDYHEENMLKIHKTYSLIFDYNGTEDYDAKYAMIDFNIGSKLNIIAGSRIEDIETNYNSFKGMASTFPDFSFAGSDSANSHTRKNSHTLPALFLKYDPYDWLSLRYASTKTLTRPSYVDFLPFYHYQGNSASVLYRNKFLEPGISRNNDYVISVNDDKLGLLTFSYFTKEIEGLIYSSGRRYIAEGTADSLYDLPTFMEKQIIVDYTLNNPYPADLNGFEIDYQTRFWYLPGMLSGLVFNANYTRTFSEVKYPRTEVKQEFVFVPSFQVITTNVDSFYVDRLIDQPNEIFNFSLGYDYKGFSGRLSMLYISDIFTTTNFWPEMRETTDAYQRYDLSMKQKLPIKGLELYLNIANLNEAIDVTRKRGFNRYDPSFTDEMYQDITSKNYDNIDDHLATIAVKNRAIALEQHYGSTIDFGFRFNF